MARGYPPRPSGVPDKPVLDGLEEKWSRRRDESGVFVFDRFDRFAAASGDVRAAGRIAAV
ncbi:hypothetical protein ABZY36_26595 [Streptomyces sp. NPDC006627]|uniref:hypothetical protein n=1 Tax=Streptomyces sp. NPDC006627 TaxID=3154679 RepID=UPI0033BB309B